MLAIGILPPSPAFSDCDSLAGIEDLDAFLLDKGPLSRFPTPGLKSILPWDAEDEDDDDNIEAILEAQGPLSSLPTPPLPASQYRGTRDRTLNDETLDLPDGASDSCRNHPPVLPLTLVGFLIASALAKEIRPFATPARDDTALIDDLLRRARQPLEILAIAFAILRKLSTTSSPSADLSARGPDLLLVSALALANIHTSDRPFHCAAWARLLRDRRITARDVDATNLTLLARLGWTVHDLCSPESVQTSLRALQTHSDLDQPPHARAQPSRLHIGPPCPACWLACQLTPDATPPRSALDGSAASQL